MPALTATSRARASVDTGPDSWNLRSRISWMKSSSYGLAHGLCKDGWSNARLQPAEPELPSTQVQIGWNRSLRIRWMKSLTEKHNATNTEVCRARGLVWCADMICASCCGESPVSGLSWPKGQGGCSWLKITGSFFENAHVILFSKHFFYVFPRGLPLWATCSISKPRMNPSINNCVSFCYFIPGNFCHRPVLALVTINSLFCPMCRPNCTLIRS